MKTTDAPSAEQALRGCILALRRLHFDPDLLAADPAATEARRAREGGPNADADDYWVFGDGDKRYLRQMGPQELEGALAQATGLLRQAYAQLQRVRDSLGKPPRL